MLKIYSDSNRGTIKPEKTGNASFTDGFYIGLQPVN
jgi:hypothetical protein